MMIKGNTGGWDLDSHNPVAVCPQRHAPALFIHGVEDDLIPMSHTGKLADKYAGPNDTIYTEGGHNSERNSEVMEQLLKFIANL